MTKETLQHRIMKIFKGPQSTNTWSQTDTKSLAEWANTWKPGKTVNFDGTIDKCGQRHTTLGVEIEFDDIVALTQGIFHYQADRITELELGNNKLREQMQESGSKHSETIELLEQVFTKIESLITKHRNAAPSTDAVFEAVEKIAAHFSFCAYLTNPVELDWIEWDRI